MQLSRAVRVGTAAKDFAAAPINPEWILEGTPVTRSEVLFESADRAATTVLWDCTAGRFKWYYAYDETFYVIEGGATLKDRKGKVDVVKAGDTIFFPAGTDAEWTVDNYIRKVAFCRFPLPRALELCKQAMQTLKRMLGRGASSAASRGLP